MISLEESFTRENFLLAAASKTGPREGGGMRQVRVGTGLLLLTGMGWAAPIANAGSWAVPPARRDASWSH